MRKLTPVEAKWNKTFHMLSACLWGGGAFAMVLLHSMFSPVSGEALYGRDICLKIIDQYVVTAGAFGCLISGLIYALMSNWGFFKFKWLIIKWAVNIGFIVFGFIFYMPWLDHMSRLSGNAKEMVLQTPEYLRSQTLNEITSFAVFGCLVMLVWLSVFKPWGRTSPGK
ncbi:DUF2269 family protein [Maridesulfovibrio sp.]|uniref:DUF2269 family protein n=1 Tax=Maridesulfovibrio sp. TaxID=2795000 RepID=UPI002A186DA0|nr:DUF2269 family protein [Maridesulfovibrio sp.]